MNRRFSISGDEILVISESGSKFLTYGNNSIKILEKQNNIELLNNKIKENLFEFNNKEKNLVEKRSELLFKSSILFASLASVLVALSSIVYISLPALFLLLSVTIYSGISIKKYTKKLKHLQRQYLLKNEMLTKMSDEENKELDKLISEFKYMSETHIIDGNVSNMEILKKLDELDQSLTKYLKLKKCNYSYGDDELVEEIKNKDQQLHDKIYTKTLF